jgi:hypothetical protein
MRGQIDWIYVYIGIGIIAAGFIFAIGLWRRISAGPSAARMHAVMEGIGGLRSHRWYVKEKVQLRGGIGLVIAMEGYSKHRTLISFRSGHPSIPVVSELVHMDIIEFEVEKDPMECALKEELCAYLKVKKVGHFS